MRALLMCNPASGGAPDVAGTTEALEALGLAIVSDEAQADRVVVVGGDGSIAPAAERAARLGVPLAVVAAGTANDFARAHGLPADVDEAVALAATGRSTTALELAFLDDRPFVNVASAGLAPAAARRAEPLKKALGPLAYTAGAAVAGAREEPLALTATADGEPAFDGEAWQVTVASSGAFGGGAEIDEADPGDGRLDLLVVPGASRTQLPKVGLAMRQGTLAQLDGVVHVRARAVEVGVPAGTPFNVDGEVVEAGTTARFTVRGAAFRLVVPGPG